ncbi:hypothetical protein AAIH56_36075, partial [Pseudomonas aeruginosa]|uniref:hypothetical protein n=1 Tax=Pseudomonas aeruginosa TaxID=287 RepID=UPI0031B776F9
LAGHYLERELRRLAILVRRSYQRAVALGRATAWTFGERAVSADTDEFMVWLPGLAAGVPRASCPIEVFGNVVGWRAAGGRR